MQKIARIELKLGGVIDEGTPTPSDYVASHSVAVKAEKKLFQILYC